MKKIITTTILTTTILALGLLQGASTAYADFSLKDFSGHYGFNFSGDPVSLGGTLVITSQLTANGDGKAWAP